MGLPARNQELTLLPITGRQLLSILLVIWVTACGSDRSSVTVPPSYRGQTPPAAGFMTNPSSIKAGEKLYNQHCATCHGDTGRGDGLAGHTQPLNPANLADPRGVVRKPLDYWFWRVSEGGTAEPFHSQGSVMPAWKHHLSELERWQVIAYARRLAATR